MVSVCAPCAPVKKSQRRTLLQRGAVAYNSQKLLASDLRQSEPRSPTRNQQRRRRGTPSSAAGSTHRNNNLNLLSFDKNCFSNEFESFNDDKEGDEVVLIADDDDDNDNDGELR